MSEGFGVVDAARLGRQIDTVAQTFALPARPPIERIYDAAFLPPAGDRRVAPK